MKSTELYRILGAELGPWFKDRGFKRVRVSPLGFKQPVNDVHHAVWFQCDKWGWDQYAGSSFFVNFEVSRGPKLDTGVRRSERINYFMTDDELEAARMMRDAIVRRIPPPPDSYFEALIEGMKGWKDFELMKDSLRSPWEPEPLPYVRTGDISLRYWLSDDVVGWTRFILPVLPRALDQMRSWIPEPPR